MRKHSLRLLVALITLVISLSSSWLLHRLRQPKPAPAGTSPCLTPPTSPAPQCVAIHYEDDDSEYPDDNDLTPSDISSFIENHPRGKLAKLWARLNIRDEENHSDFSECCHCEARLDYYDLDMEPGEEALLKISDDVRESYRYLIFKRLEDTNGWRLAGHIDEWGKYRDSQSVILISGGRTWLVTLGQSVSGSGVASYHNRVFAATTHGLKEVAEYECEGHQSGMGEWPTRDFSTRILQVQSQGNQTLVKIEFNLDYSVWTNSNKVLRLFKKRQIAVFVSAGNSSSVLNQSNSTVTQRELDHIYQIDSMTEDDFLKYNHSELLNLAKRGTKPQKNWLNDLLKTCDDSAEKRRLFAALAK